jgi:deoxyribonuclease-4
LNVGGHLSLGRNAVDVVRSAHDSGFGSMQIFASSPGAWKPPVIDAAAASDFAAARQRFEVDPLVIHAIYLINLASPDETLVRRSASSLVATLRAGSTLRAAGVVTHIGSHGGRGFDEVVDQVAANVRGIIGAAGDDIDLMLENSAGAGGIIGATMQELGEIIARAGRPERLKVAIDTAHLCGAGWDFTDPDAALRLVREIENFIGLDRLALIHANDSSQPAGSRKDRHANIGAGHIGQEGFRHLLAQPALRRIPWILETPDIERRADDLRTLRSLLPVSALPGGTYAE